MLLTLFRLIFSPFLLPIFLVNFIPYNSFAVNISLTILFVLLSLTDLLDGYLARRLDLESEFGKVLDPIADKFLLYSTLIALLVVGKIFYYWVILLIGRELFIMGLRMVALENDFSVHVSSFGKLKTAVQFLYLTFLILDPVLFFSDYQNLIQGTQSVLLFLTLVLSLGSAYAYYKQFMKVVGTRIYEGDFN
jgi:CDP-diacylglycerol--glycerol-3-phosphate 3-phosphatidyltransferase